MGLRAATKNATSGIASSPSSAGATNAATSFPSESRKAASPANRSKPSSTTSNSTKAATRWPTGRGKKSKRYDPNFFSSVLCPLTSYFLLSTFYFSLGQAARSLSAIVLYSSGASFLLGAGGPGAFPPKDG